MYNAFLRSTYAGQIKIKWNSSSTPLVHKGNFLWLRSMLMWRHFSVANWWEDRRILDKILLFFCSLFGEDIPKFQRRFWFLCITLMSCAILLLLATLLCTYLSILFSKVVKICRDLRNLGTSKHQETLIVQVSFSRRCPVICIYVRVNLPFKHSVCIPEDTNCYYSSS